MERVEQELTEEATNLRCRNRCRRTPRPLHRDLSGWPSQLHCYLCLVTVNNNIVFSVQFLITNIKFADVFVQRLNQWLLYSLGNGMGYV